MAMRFMCLCAVFTLVAATVHDTQKRGEAVRVGPQEEGERVDRLEARTLLANGTTPSNGRQLLPVDCADHLMLGRTTNGVYEIYPYSCSCRQPVQVWCDMETDGGGWTVFSARHRQTPQENFNRSWVEYRQGFGSAEGEFWIGNDVLHKMTSSRRYSLRIDMTLTNGIQYFSEWETVKVGDEADKYKIEVQNYLPASTMFANCLTHINGRYFSTYDRDLDSTSANCAMTRAGGWWYYNCRSMSLTGQYNNGLSTVCSREVQLSETQMKMRPAICSESFKTISFSASQCQSCL